MFSKQLITISLILIVAILKPASGKLNGKTNSVIIDDITEYKDFKKLLRTKTNVLVLYTSNTKQSAEQLRVFKETAEAIKGSGTMVLMDCSQADKKKLCKKLKVNPAPVILKHYKEGDFHKDYDRQMSATSMINFMRDPAGDLPWEEDAMGKDVLHFTDYVAFVKHLKKDPRPMLIMFYVPWCGFCKRLKPDYSKAATELKSEGYILAAMDVEKQANAMARRTYNITGFPTIMYFENGKMKQIYESDSNKEAIMAFMRDPTSLPIKKPKETDWSADTNSEIVHLTKQNFEPALKEEKSVLVMFYAPWCGHCKRLKPEYEKAALEMKQQHIPGVLAALDATKEPALAEQFSVAGYPTLKYFVNGQFKYDVNFREATKIVDFMKEPKEPPPPPPPEKSWEEEEDSEVLFLNEQTFSSTLKRKKHALVMFYAPWCGHCKSTKPEFNAAAKALKEDPRMILAAVDCTRDNSVCLQQEVRGYPTIKYFSYLKTKSEYVGGRKREDFIAYMKKANEIAQNVQHEEL
ncbi:protein disulfide-isomerase A5 [Lucilia sericata]|uniref:protein disulfide-isomerase A5 n=1 Tax=Lucilia sericata TaxID=13632 RepID=UPI0018A804D3|nr:protein disulfide-isomerase A5 [Lucilia sericata]